MLICALNTLGFERVFPLRLTRFALSVWEIFVEVWLRRPCLDRSAVFAKASRNLPLRSKRFALSVWEIFVEAWLRRPCLGRFATFAKASRNSPAAPSVGFAYAFPLCGTPWRPFLQPIERGLAKSSRCAQRGASVWIARGRAEGRAAAKARVRHPCQGQGAHDLEALTGAILRQPERLQPQPGLR